MRLPRNSPVLAAARAESYQQPALQVSTEEQSAPGMSLNQISTIVRAYWRQSLMIALGVIVLAAVVIKLVPKTYEGKATLMVSNESTDPLSRVAATISPNYLQTEMELMRSDDVLRPVVDKLNLASNEHYTAGFKNKPGADLRDYIKDKLVKDVDIEQGRFGAQLIYITAAASDPVLAANIANAVTDTYLGQQRERVSGPASDRAKAYSAELAELKHKVSVAQEQVTAFRQRTGETDAANQTANVEADLLTSLEMKYQDAQNNERVLEAAVAHNTSAGTTNASGPTEIQTLKTQLAEQNKNLAQLQSTMGPAHPRVIELKNQIAATQRAINEESGYQSSGLVAQLAAARQLREKDAQAVEQQRAKVLGSRKLQDEGTKYVLELESAQSVYKRALDGYDEIMFASSEHRTNVGLVSRAQPAIEATKPNKVKLFMLGIVAALIIGLAAPFAYELILNRRVRCRDDFERGFGIPVLSEFDEIKFSPSAA